MKGLSPATVYFARWILAGTQLIEDGAIRIVGDTIDQIGNRTGIRQSGDRFVNLGNRIIIPGLINLHTSLEEAQLRGTITPQSSHVDFLLTKEKYSATSENETIINAARLIINESLINGITTTVSNIRQLSISDFEPFEGRQIILRHCKRNDAHSRFELASSIREGIKKREIYGSTPDRMFTLSPQWLKEIQRTILSDNGLFMMHLGESPEERLAFSENSGELFNRLKDQNQWFYPKSSRGAIWYALSNNLIPRGSTVINPYNCGADELSAINSLQATIAISPRYSEFFNLHSFPFELVDARKLSLAVITETPAVAKTMNLLDELFEIRKVAPTISALELIKMATINPAKALRISHKRGVIQKGYDADIIAIDISQFTQDPLEEIISGNGNVGFVMVRGEEIIVPSV